MMRLNLLSKRVLLATACIVLGLGGGCFMVSELFELWQRQEKATMFSLSCATYACAYFIGDTFLRSKHPTK